MPTLVLVSDTHGRHADVHVPDGDILVHAGDFTRVGKPAEVIAFDLWLAGLPHRHKVVVAGNHDFLFERDPDLARILLRHATYLQDDAVTLDGITIYGSPWQPWFHDWAFNVERGPKLAAKWARIPAGVDVLVTHGPPAGVLDLTKNNERVGCADLRERLRAVKPRLHLFGHIHEAAGVEWDDGTLFVNASRPGGGPAVVVRIEDGKVEVI